MKKTFAVLSVVLIVFCLTDSASALSTFFDFEDGIDQASAEVLDLGGRV